MFTGPEDYWLPLSPSSFNDDLRRENGWKRRQQDSSERKRGKQKMSKSVSRNDKEVTERNLED